MLFCFFSTMHVIINVFPWFIWIIQLGFCKQMAVCRYYRASNNLSCYPAVVYKLWPRLTGLVLWDMTTGHATKFCSDSPLLNNPCWWWACSVGPLSCAFCPECHSHARLNWSQKIILDEFFFFSPQQIIFCMGDNESSQGPEWWI